MFTRPPSDSRPPPYSPGYLAFPPASTFPAASSEAHDLSDRVKQHGEKLKAEREELERLQAKRAELDAAWQHAEEARHARRAKLKEEALKAEIEWERMGGRRARDAEAGDAELRRKLDTDATLTAEERAFKRAWEEYDKAWNCLVTSIRPAKSFTFRKLEFAFADIPWPVMRVGNSSTVHSEHITAPAVASFLLHPLRDPSKSRRDKLREAILRYHPDKFEGRILHRVIAEDRARVQETAVVVMKCLNELMSQEF